MAVVLLDGFDLYNGTSANTGLQAKYTVSTAASASISLVTGRFGGQAVRMTYSGGSSTSLNCSRSLPSTYTNFTDAFAMRFNGAPPGQNNFFRTYFSTAGGAYQLGIRCTSTGALQVFRATNTTGGGTLLGTTAAGVIQNTVWHYVEFSAKIDASTGTIALKVDGVTVLNLTGQNTKNASTTTIDLIRLGHDTGVNDATYTLDIDDWYVLDTTTSNGERRVETLHPHADVAQGFTRSTGATNYTLVNEAQCNGDTNYVQGSNVGDVDTYDFEDLSSTPGTIDALQFTSFAEKTDAASRSIALQVKSGATTSDGSNYSLAVGYAKLERLLEQDPNTSAAWTSTAVNAVRGGPKVTV